MSFSRRDQQPPFGRKGVTMESSQPGDREMKIHQFLWNDLELDQPGRLRDASMCFYLGYGVEETRKLLNGYNPRELRDVRELAPLNGFKEPENLASVVNLQYP